MTLRRGAKVECSHYWIINKPEGAISKGICKYCGAEREFFNDFLAAVSEQAKGRVAEADIEGQTELEDGLKEAWKIQAFLDGILWI